MKIRRINTAFLLLALAGMTLTGCSNEDIANVNPQEEGTGNVSFSIVEKDYEPADNTPKSRAAIEETKPEIQDLGDGLMAEVSLVPDTTHRADVPKTRAINTPTHYTIQAFQGGVKKGELKGTFNGSTFTPDAGQPKSISLPHGTYDFVCFNDGVTANGTQLTVNRADAGTARFDVQRNVHINQDPKQQVKFTMKHAGAKIVLYVSFNNFILQTITTSTPCIGVMGEPAYKNKFVHSENDCDYKVETATNSIPEKMVYNLSTDATIYPTMGQISKSDVVEPVPSAQAWTHPGAKGGSQYSYLLIDHFLPTTNCSKFKVTFTNGGLLGTSLVGKSITVPENKQVESNKQYLIIVRLNLTDRYVYSDGTSGIRTKNLSKVPVGVVIWSSEERFQSVAVTLQDYKDGGNDQIQWANSTSQETTSPQTDYSNLFWKNEYGMASKSYGSPYFPFSNNSASRVFDFVMMGHSIGRMNEDGIHYRELEKGGFVYLIPSDAATGSFTPAPSTINFPAMDMTRFNNAFTKVGGTPPSGTYWTSTECKDGTEYKMATITISSDGKFHLGLKSKTETAKVRPFIFY